jgi:thiamine biosynthesis protein ThiS
MNCRPRVETSTSISGYRRWKSAYAGKRVAVERNGEIVPKSKHAATPLAEGDQVEIVVAVGGG